MPSLGSVATWQGGEPPEVRNGASIRVVRNVDSVCLMCGSLRDGVPRSLRCYSRTCCVAARRVPVSSMHYTRSSHCAVCLWFRLLTV